MRFRNYRLWKSCLVHSLKSVVSEHALTVNMWKRPKYLENLQESTFVMFFHHSHWIWFRKCLPLVLGEILVVFLKNWLPMASILFTILRICNSQFKCNYLKNKKLSVFFFFHFWNLYQILNILKKTMIVMVNVFPKWQTAEILLKPLSKKCRFRTRFDSQHVKASQMLVKSTWVHFCHVFLSLSGKLIWQMSLLVLSKALVVFVNRLTVDGEYLVHNSENLQVTLEMQLS